MYCPLCDSCPDSCVCTDADYAEAEASYYFEEPEIRDDFPMSLEYPQEDMFYMPDPYEYA